MAVLHTARIEYQVLGVEMVGHLAVDRAAGADDKPGVLLMHEGGGQDDNVRARADRLAELGYVAFALDYLGGGCVHPLATAQARLGELFGDLAATRQLAVAGYDVLVAQPGVDSDRVAAVGFCFGGVMALELARSGVPLRAAIGLHPGFAVGERGRLSEHPCQRADDLRRRRPGGQRRRSASVRRRDA